MDKKTIRITGAQCSFSVGAIQENKETILNCFEEAESVESDIVIFPELAITGYPPEDLLLRESFIGKNFAVLEEIAAFSSHTSGVIGFVDRKNDSHNQDNNKRTIANAAQLYRMETLEEYIINHFYQIIQFLMKLDIFPKAQNRILYFGMTTLLLGLIFVKIFGLKTDQQKSK